MGLPAFTASTASLVAHSSRCCLMSWRSTVEYITPLFQASGKLILLGPGVWAATGAARQAAASAATRTFIVSPLLAGRASRTRVGDTRDLPQSDSAAGPFRRESEHDARGELAQGVHGRVLARPAQRDPVVGMARKDVQVQVRHCLPPGGAVGLQQGEPRRPEGALDRARDAVRGREER